MGKVLGLCGATCLAWALMPTHFHLLFRTGHVPLWRVMHRVLTGHAVYFNLRHERVGHLFQNRYRSILVEEDLYLTTLVRYIHLNPVTAGIVANLEALDSYPWTGHAALVGGARAEPFHDTRRVLEQFACVRGDHERLVEWMQLGVGQVPEPTMFATSPGARADVGILGSEAFQAAVLARADLSALRWVNASKAVSLDSIIAEACVRFEVSERELCSGARSHRASAARASIALIAVESGYRQDVIAVRLKIGQPAVSAALRRALQADVIF